ncbi:TonB-dependent receptor [Ponticaulis sp.]|uniref:TonB-dependent receptor domain-containing protein n=1 Tax=Ponticaulis sp. TaxID=2020902 RepID=UPI0026015953|nr:TonB-dependent receptor [Ponticaulis sp.]
MTFFPSTSVLTPMKVSALALFVALNSASGFAQDHDERRTPAERDESREHARRDGHGSRDRHQGNNEDADNKLEEIVVTASGRAQSVEQAPASISIIGREELERTPYREVTDALLDIPGVTVSSGEGNSRDISIRGMSPQYTLILVDGKRLSAREARTNGGNISEGGLLPPLESIERIEVVRGPMSSLYGSDAMGGVVNIITKRVSDEWNGQVRLNGTHQLEDGYGNYQDANFYLSGPIIADTLGVQLSGSLNHREGDQVIGGTPERNDSSINAKFTWRVSDDHSLMFEAGRFNQEVIEVAGETYEADEDSPAGTRTEQTQDRNVFSIQHDGSWGNITSSSYVQYEDAVGTDDNKSIQNTVGQTSFIVPLGQHTFNVGGFYRNEQMHDETSNRLSDRTDAERTQFALFVEDEWRLFEDFALTGGIRMDNDEEYGDHWTPRLYAVWNVTEDFTLKGGYSAGFRAPNLRQTLPDWGQVSRGGTIYGNPALEAETSQNVEIGIFYTFSDRLQVSATAYQTKFEDRITRVTCESAGAWCIDEPLSSIGRPPTTYVNIDEAEINGLEFTASAELTSTISLDGSVSFTDSEQLTGDNAGAALNDTPEQQGSLSLNWEPTDELNTYVRAVYRGDEAVTEAQISGSNYVTSSYTTVDLGGSYRVAERSELFFGVQNLFNEQLTVDDGYSIDGTRVWLGMSAGF